MPLFGHFPIWAPTYFLEVICLRYGPGSLQELAAYIWDIYIFFKIITRNKALPCTLNIQIQKFLKVINTMLIVSKNLFTHFKIKLLKKDDLLKNEVL